MRLIDELGRRIGELHRRNVFRVGLAYVGAAWFLIQISSTLLRAFGFGFTALRNVIIFFAIGLIPALIFAWVFEITPEGLKRAFEVDRSRSITAQTGRKLDRIIMVLLALALGYFAFDKFVLGPTRVAELVEETARRARSDALVESYGEKSIAVLAFVDMSVSKDQEYMSDGIAEELLNLLAKIPELRVISRSSAFSFKGQDLEIPEIAERLNVGHILEGSVRTAGNQLRITAQLIEARSDTHLWSETYDRTLEDVFAIQDEIAAEVVRQLKITLLDESPKVDETDPDAYKLYLQARHLSARFTSEGFAQSNALLERALAIAPDYAAAWGSLAENYANQAGIALLPFDEGFGLAREAANRALAIDPANVEAHAQLGWIALTYDADPASAASHLERALALEPTDSRVLSYAAALVRSLGRSHEDVALQEYLSARDPVNPSHYYNLANAYTSVGRLDEAISANHTALSLSPSTIGAHYSIGAALLLEGKPEEALAAMQKEASIWRLIGLPMAHHALGQAAESDATVAELIEQLEKDAAYNIAYVRAFRGEADRAFEWLDKAVAYHDPGLSQIVIEPLFSNIHTDPRWLPFLRKIGKAPEQLAAIEFNPTLPG